MSDADDLRRAFEFLALGDMGGTRTEPTRFGTAVYDERVAQRYDSNYLLVEKLAPATTADELAADAAAHDRRMIFFRDEAAASLVPRFRALGWRRIRSLSRRSSSTFANPRTICRRIL